VPEYHLIEIPKEKLPPCQSVAIPAENIEWQEVPFAYLDVIQKLDSCNEQITAFWTWYTSQN
jgi:hypothetical protein